MSDSDFTDIDATPMSEQERRIRKQVRREAEFYKHLLTYVVVIAGLWIINLGQNGLGASIWRYWAFWATVGWGIGVACHAISAVPAINRWGVEWEERKVRELMEKRTRG